jgi:hypothetical protein
MKLFAVVLTLILAIESHAQELNCQVSVLTPSIQASDKSIYEKIQTDLRDMLNSKKWTNDEFLNQERIECNMVITISERLSDDFKANIQIQSRRPVYHSSYNSALFNHKDDDFTFRYVQDQLIDFDESNVTSNLTAVVAYYAYLIIGLDYDSYAPQGGTPYYAKAQTIVNNAQNLPDKGWKAFENTKNRYWIVENLLDVSFKPLRSFMYAYHRQGFDRFSDNIVEARAEITNNLQQLKAVYNDKPNSLIMQLFFNAKCDELINLYSQATQQEKVKAVEVFSLVDPANQLKYQGIMSGQK